MVDATEKQGPNEVGANVSGGIWWPFFRQLIVGVLAIFAMATVMSLIVFGIYYVLLTARPGPI